MAVKGLRCHLRHVKFLLVLGLGASLLFFFIFFLVSHALEPPLKDAGSEGSGSAYPGGFESLTFGWRAQGERGDAFSDALVAHRRAKCVEWCHEKGPTLCDTSSSLALGGADAALYSESSGTIDGPGQGATGTRPFEVRDIIGRNESVMGDLQEVQEAINQAGGVLRSSSANEDASNLTTSGSGAREEVEEELHGGEWDYTPMGSDLLCCNHLLASYDRKTVAVETSGSGTLQRVSDVVKKMLHPIRDWRRRFADREEDSYEVKTSREDDELLQLAATRSNLMQKVAFLFLVKKSVPFAPLWERVLRGYEDQYSIYVHASAPYETRPGESSIFRDRVVCLERVEWGKPSLIDAERRLLANALLNPLNQRFVLLSDSCIPVRDFATIYGFLMGSTLSFIHTVTNPGRYPKDMNPIVRPDQFRYGSMWWSLTREHAAIVTADTLYYSPFAHWCRGVPKEYCITLRKKEHCVTFPKVVCFADEHYVQTILDIMDGDRLDKRTLTWTHWDLPSPHPKTYTAADANTTLLEEIRAPADCEWNGKERECFLFARKFAPDALPNLLEAGQTLNLWH